MGKVMTAEAFAKKAKDIANNYKTLYVLGCFGAPMTESAKKRYTSNNAYNKSRANIINVASSDTFGFDCVCLLKGIFWDWNGNKDKIYGGAKYESNGVPDVGANTMFDKYCTDRSSDFKNIEVGEFVWMEGHIGVYIGNGLAVECTPIWKNKVQITAVGNIGKKSGYNTRTWKKHGKSIYLDYTKKTEKKPESKPTSTPIKVGDTVIVNGYGTASSSGTGAKTKVFSNKEMKVISIAGNSSRPNKYALNIYNKGKINDSRSISAWFNIKDIKKK